MEDILAHPRKINAIITAELKDVISKYAQPRRTMFLYAADLPQEEPEEENVYPVHLFFTREGYFKKITPLSLRMGGEQKLKENDEITGHYETLSSAEILFFTDKQQVYKSRASDFEDTKASVMGDYIPARLEFEPQERILAVAVTLDYTGHMLFFFDCGRVAKVPLSSYATKTRRRKLSGAYCDRFPLIRAEAVTGDREYILTSTARRKLIFDSAVIPSKAARDTQGVQVMTLKGSHRVASADPFQEGMLENSHRFRTKTLPAAGANVRPEDEGEQMKL